MEGQNDGLESESQNINHYGRLYRIAGIIVVSVSLGASLASNVYFYRKVQDLGNLYNSLHERMPTEDVISKIVTQSELDKKVIDMEKKMDRKIVDNERWLYEIQRKLDDLYNPKPRIIPLEK